MKRSLLFLVAATCALAAPAAAHVFDEQTSVTIRRAPAGTVNPGSRVVISGRVVSGRAACRVGTVVRLYLSRPGADRVLARDVTDADGDYRFVRKPVDTLRVYAVVAQTLESSYGHSHRCRGSASPIARIVVEG